MVSTMIPIRPQSCFNHLLIFILILFCLGTPNFANSSVLQLNDLNYFEARGVNFFVYHNWYDGYFRDAKITAVELIHHGVRTGTNGDVRLSRTPQQWDPIPVLIKQDVDKQKNSVKTYLRYEDYDFGYMVQVEGIEQGVHITVHIDRPLPETLIGTTGYNFEFLPAAYFEKSYLMDDKSGLFGLYPTGPMEKDESGKIRPMPLATGKTLILAPEDPERRVMIQSTLGEIDLYDGRNQAQNGWYVVRSAIPSGKKDVVVDWTITANTIPEWVRPPMIAYSQVGYHPKQKKKAVIELDPNDTLLSEITLFKIDEQGTEELMLKSAPEKWGKYIRYEYAIFDFSSVTEPGVYVIQYGDAKTGAFRIDDSVYETAWQPSLDVYLPVQMDHMLVNDAYRIWHGAAHLDDALQAPVNHEHFDLYAQGPTTDTAFKPGEHIPGLNVGGWFDAGDYDIRTQTQYAVVRNLVELWERFHPDRDQTLVHEKDRYVDLHHPDGVPDVLQQIEHGTLYLMSQYKAVGHAINGIIAPTLGQYTHLGDGSTQTDNKIFHPALDSLETDGVFSGTFDDRWAFTNKSSTLNYGSAAALAAAGRVLGEINLDLANESLEKAIEIWREEATHPPDTFRHGNTTGGSLKGEKLNAAVELLIATNEKEYRDVIRKSVDPNDRFIFFTLGTFIKAIPYMDDDFKTQIRTLIEDMQKRMSRFKADNPFDVYISRGTWAGNGGVMGMALSNYYIYKVFPDLVEPEQILAGLNYLYGCHPGSNVSFVSGVGAKSKKVAYGNNRADFSFIAGGVVPGVLIVKPDFPENKEDWPFFWGENEYVVSGGPTHLLLVHAVMDVLNSMD